MSKALGETEVKTWEERNGGVTCLSSRALALELGDAIATRRAVVARPTGAVVDVDAAVAIRPAVYADAVEAAHLVLASAAVLAHVWLQALVQVLGAVPA